MRCFKEMDGVVFDVAEDSIDRFEDIFNHLRDEKRIDFEIGRCKNLPELKEDDSAIGGYGQGGYGQGGYGGQGGYSNGGRGGYGQG
jgi:hypothetical protein